jgi:2-oxoglutarate ferredoxin oxidoreductase subunit beta
MTAKALLSAADFSSDQDIRWCPGCGDYSILAQMKKVLPLLGLPPEKLVFVSGIGCSSRFPYYLNTYGVHGIHGRAPAIATGLKITRPELQVWVITGDGDALSIGGNHLMHAIRRNIDINILLFNNRVYGLTKGQYSPTSPLGQVTKSTPGGSIDSPLNPLAIAIGSEASFVARSIDVHTKHLGMVLRRAAEHRGTSFVEIYQNCNVFNDRSFEYASDRQQRPDNIIELEHGQPLVFGTQGNKGIRLNGLQPEVVILGSDGVDKDQLLIHDESTPQSNLAYLLAGMRYPQFPEPIGVLRAVSRPCYEKLLQGEIDEERKQQGEGSLQQLFHSGDTWTVE